MGDTDKVLAKAPGGLKMTPGALESWKAVTLGLTYYCLFCLSHSMLGADQGQVSSESVGATYSAGL